MVIVSCSGKFHAFNLAEQLNKHRQLTELWTAYAYQKNTLARRFVSRVDNENIPVEKIYSCLPVAVGLKLWAKPEYWNECYDQYVATALKWRHDDYKILIGWSGMSLKTLLQAKKRGKIAIVERGSSHILYQDRILKEEYRKFGKNFSIPASVIKKELEEYDLADYISIPSIFVKNSFLEYGIPESKLIQNPYGCNQQIFAQAAVQKTERRDGKFTVLYLGRLSIRKGLIYLFQALEKTQQTFPQVEAVFIGSVEEDLKPLVSVYSARNPKWKFMGHIPHQNLPDILKRCDVAVQSSLEEGLSMVIPQIMTSGIPVIATTNSGGEDIIQHGETGFIVPIRDSNAIAEKLSHLIGSPKELQRIQENLSSQQVQYSWDQYGARWAQRINILLSVV